MYIIGRSGSGKSTLLINMILYIIKRGYGLCLFDFHGQTADELLDKLPSSAIDRTVYIKPGDENFTLCMNLFNTDDEKIFGKLVGECVECLKGMFQSGWGHRLEHILGKLIYGLFVLKGNLADIPVLLSQTSKGQMLRSEIIQKATNLEVKRFFQHEFTTYSKTDLLPLINKFSNLLLDERILRLFSVKDNKIHIREIMDESKIVIGDLSIGSIPSDTASYIATLFLSQFNVEAMNRSSKSVEQRKPFYIFIDEFHRLTSFAVIESIINECRKYGLFLTLCHQESGQISDDVLKALRSMTNTLVFNVNIDDARRMTKLFDDRVSVSDIIGLGVGEVYARINNHVVNFKTFPPIEKAEGNAQKIIQQSREKYYIPVENFQKEIYKKKNRDYDLF